MQLFKALGVALATATLANAAQLLAITPLFSKQCAITQVDWTGGEEPYAMLVLKDDEVVEAFRDIPETNAVGTVFTWITNIKAGQEVRIEVFDAVGAVAPTGLFTIQPGTDNCTLLI